MTSFVLKPGYTYDKGSVQIWEKMVSVTEALLEEKWLFRVQMNENAWYKEQYEELKEEVDTLIESFGKTDENGSYADTGSMMKIRKNIAIEDCYIYMAASGGDSYRVAKEFLARVFIDLLTEALHKNRMNLTVEVN